MSDATISTEEYRNIMAVIHTKYMRITPYVNYPWCYRLELFLPDEVIIKHRILGTYYDRLNKIIQRCAVRTLLRYGTEYNKEISLRMITYVNGTVPDVCHDMYVVIKGNLINYRKISDTRIYT